MTRTLTWTLLVTALVTRVAGALEPNEIVLVTNKNVPASGELAAHYAKARGIPDGHTIALDLPTGEDISRADYDNKIVTPLREALKEHRGKVRLLLTFHGVPLRVAGPPVTADERKQINEINAEVAELGREIKELKSGTPEYKAKDGRRDQLLARRKRLSHAEDRASVDSELMLLWMDDYRLRRWQANPFYFQASDGLREALKDAVMTCRLDGPTPAVIKRMIDDAVAVEKKGLAGKVYVDARGIGYDPKRQAGTGYAGYDQSMRETAKLFENAGADVTLDDKQALFKPGQCEDCAIYCGWYSHAKFIDCCKLVPGSVAWHLASSECVSLRRDDRNYWCKGLLENGACATLGPVAEPYTVGFPKPAEFFGFLATGEYTLAECYAKSVMMSSWMGVLLGDPLYNPFGKKPLIKEGDVVPSPRR